MQKRMIVMSLLTAISAIPNIAAAQTPAAAAPGSTFSGNLTIASEYIYRGIGQTNRKPAIQGGVDWAHSSGFYLGNWNSNVSWLSDQSRSGAPISNSIEMDFYGGFKGEITKDLGFDVGYLYYYYPGSYPAGYTSPDTGEVYGALSYGPFTLKYSQSTTNLFGNANSKNSGYVDLSSNWDVGHGLTVSAHIGHQTVKNFSDASYTDHKLSIAKDISGYSLAAAYVGTNAKGDAGQPYQNAYGKDLGKSRLVVSLSKSF